ncbi:hypothetical protein KO465_02715 [Candidatus Micrarchaeota archaeon]|nr:hypothetical protein [Candidatus Micrarchaeota archaeon]
MPKLLFTIPTYRPREVQNCVTAYARNFERFGHNTPIIVFDDSSLEKSSITLQNLKRVKDENPFADIWYVGPEEKNTFLKGLHKENPDPLIPNMMKPSYGGNRNWILLATLGNHFISVDDDIFPYGIFGEGAEKNPNSVLEGHYSATVDGFKNVEMDIISAYSSMIGMKVKVYMGQNPGTITGKHLIDSNTDLELNVSVRGLQDGYVTVEPGVLNKEATIKIVQSYLSGDADIDSKDIIDEFLKNPKWDTLRGEVPLKYIINRYEPCVVESDYRLTGAVLGLDNTEGFICFLPTQLRFEDYIFRKFSHKPNIHVGYCPAVQTHCRNMENRNNIVKDFIIEEIATIIKKTIINGVKSIDELKVRLEKNPSYDVNDLYELWNSLIRLSKQTNIHQIPGEVFYDKILEGAISVDGPGEFVSFHVDLIDKEYVQIKESIEIWPEIIEYTKNNPVPFRKIK